jgi:hypothetical protein
VIRVLRIARGDVPGDAFIESKFRKEAKRRGEPFLAVPALLFNGGELRRSGKTRISYGSGCHESLRGED